MKPGCQAAARTCSCDCCEAAPRSPCAAAARPEAQSPREAGRGRQMEALACPWRFLFLFFAANYGLINWPHWFLATQLLKRFIISMTSTWFSCCVYDVFTEMHLRTAAEDATLATGHLSWGRTTATLPNYGELGVKGSSPMKVT